MFDQALDELIKKTGAELAIFCDYEGESIAHAPRTGDGYEVRLVGAQLAALTHALQQLAKSDGQTERVSLACTTDQRTWLIEALAGRYYVLLSLPPKALWPRARIILKTVAERFAGEL